MKLLAVLAPILALFLAFSFAAAEPPTQENTECPAHQAADQNMKLFQSLHQVIAPAWHEYYPGKNLKALADAIFKLDGMLPEVKAYTHAFKTEERQAKFSDARSRFIELVGIGMEAKKNDDLNAVYDIIPELHESFEMMASNALPLSFPEYASLRTVVDLMIDMHLANKDYDAIVTSTEALKIKNEQFQKAALPADLTSVASQVKADISLINSQCRELENACSSGNNQAMTDCLNKLKTICDKFENDYI